MTPEAFGIQLLYARQRAGLTQRGLAALAGLDPTYLARIEEGKRPPPSRHLVERLAEVLPLEGPIGRDLFFAAAGLLPPGGWDPAMTSFRRLLGRPELHDFARRDAFLSAVAAAFTRVVREDEVRQAPPVLLHERVLV